MIVERLGDTYKLNGSLLEYFALKDVIFELIEPEVTLLSKMHIRGYSVDDVKEFGAVINEEEYNPATWQPDPNVDELDQDFMYAYDNYDEYYNACHYIGYIPEGMTAELVTHFKYSGTMCYLKRNGIEIINSENNYKYADFEVTPTKNGKIIFEYARDYPHFSFDDIVNTIRRDAGKFDYDFTLKYQTRKDRMNAKLKGGN